MFGRSYVAENEIQEVLNRVADQVAQWADEAEVYPDDGDHSETLWRVAAWLRDDQFGPVATMRLEEELEELSLDG